MNMTLIPASFLLAALLAAPAFATVAEPEAAKAGAPADAVAASDTGTATAGGAADVANGGAAAEPDPAALAKLQEAVHAGRFAEAYKRGLRSAPAGEVRDRVLALDDEIVDGVFARIVARRLDATQAAAIADFYASDAGTALTAAQLADPGATPPTPAQREAIAAFFASDTGRLFNSLLADEAVMKELQMALAFVAGPAG